MHLQPVRFKDRKLSLLSVMILNAFVVNRHPIEVRSNFLSCAKYPSTMVRNPVEVPRRRKMSSILSIGNNVVYRISSQLKLSNQDGMFDAASDGDEVLKNLLLSKTIFLLRHSSRGLSNCMH